LVQLGRREVLKQLSYCRVEEGRSKDVDSPEVECNVATGGQTSLNDVKDAVTVVVVDAKISNDLSHK
jgi:hypothetical protein